MDSGLQPVLNAVGTQNPLLGAVAALECTHGRVNLNVVD